MIRRNRAAIAVNRKLVLAASLCLTQPVWAQSIIFSGSVAQFGTGITGNPPYTVGNKGASFDVPQNLLIADSNQVGTVTIQDGAVLSVRLWTGMSNISSSTGTLNILNGGVLQTANLVSGSNNTTVNIDGGIIRANSDQATFVQGTFAANSIRIASGGLTLDTQGFTIGINNTAGVITGAGTLTKQGSGTINMTGSNTWSGGTTVSAGTLSLTTYNQAAGQTLTFGASGNATYGKLVVTGAATFNAGAKLAVDVAKVNTLAEGQTLKSVVSAGTLNASTFSVTDNSALLNFAAVLNGNAVDLNITRAATIADATNAQSMTAAYEAARTLDTWSNTGDTGTVISAFNRLPSQADVARAVNQTLPQNGDAQATLGTLASINRVITGRFVDAGSGISSGELANKQAWVKPFGGRANQRDQNNVSGYSANMYGIAAGLEADVGREGDARVGLSYAYANTRVGGNAALTGTDRHTNVDSNVVTAYASKPFKGGVTLNLQADAGWNNNRGSRNISFGGLNRTANGSYDAYSFHTGASLSKAIAIGQASAFIPAVRADYTRLKARGYTETGADALNLSVGSNTTEAFVVGLDGRFVHAINARSQVEAIVGAGYDAINDKGNLVAAYAGTPGQSFTVGGLDHGPWLYRAGLGYTYKLKQGVDIAVRYDAEGRSGFLNQAASVRAAWQF